MEIAADSFHEALKAHRSGDVAAAMALYRRSLAEDPDNLDAQFNLAALTATLGLIDDAKTLYEQILSRHPDEADTLVNLGNLFQVTGEADEAEACYRRALTVSPTLAVAKVNLGSLLLDRGALEAAIELFQEALAIDPCLPAALNGLANAMIKLGRHADAIEPLEAAAAIDPSLLDPWRNLGMVRNQLGQPEQALDSLKRAEQCDPKDAMTQALIGDAYYRLEEMDSAIVHLRRAVDLAPESPQFLNDLGMALNDHGRHEDAAAVLQHALELDRRQPEAWTNLGNCLAQLGRTDDAIGCYQEALAIAPGLAVAACNLGNNLRKLGRLSEAVDAFNQAISHAPDFAMAYNGLALVRQQENRNEQAVELLRRAVEIRPDYPEALNNLAIALGHLNRVAEAIDVFQRLLEVKPDLPEALFNLASVLQSVGRHDEAIMALRQCLALRPDYRIVYPYLVHSLMQQCKWTNLDGIIGKIRHGMETELAQGRALSVPAFAMQSLPGEFSMELRQRAAEHIAGNAEAEVAEVRAGLRLDHRRPAGKRKLTIGYVSPDFRFHSVAVAFRGILDNHDRDAFDLVGYSLFNGVEDDLTRYFELSFDRFRRINDSSYSETAEQIDRDRIDILIDLAGHTLGSRLPIFALRAAPVQAHYLGYSATIGARFLDYLITDHAQVPSENRRYFTENLVYLPDTFMATQRSPVAVDRPSRRDCGLPEDGIVFANFNSHYKFDPHLFAIWMRLLRQLPGSVLWLLAGTPGCVENLRREAAARNVDPARLVFAPKITHPEHLARLQLADLALDNLYHGGGVTTVDALWTGVPVLSIASQTPQSRNGATLLTAIGMEDLIVHGIDDYERLALKIAADPALRQSLRDRLVANRDTYPLFHPERLTRHLELAYQLMWRNHVDGRPPAMIEVPALPAETT